MDVELAEDQRVELWVIDQLRIAGFDGDQIAQLLRASERDPEAWRRAAEYVRDGCKHELAVRIVF